MFADFKNFYIRNYDMAGSGRLMKSVKSAILGLHSAGNDAFETCRSRKCMASGVFIYLLALHFFVY